MSKEFDEYLADKPELNLISKEEVSLLKIKIGKNHRNKSDWEVIKEIFWKRDVITFVLLRKAKRFTTIKKIFSENGYLIVFSNIDDCTKYIQEMQRIEKFERFVHISSIPFIDVLEIADQYDMDVLIDVNKKINSKCFMYAHKENLLKVVILA